MCHCGKDPNVVCCGPACCKTPLTCASCKMRLVTKPRLDPPTRSMTITREQYTTMRMALYDAKLALESSFDGKDLETVLAKITKALDATRNLPDVINGS